MNQEIKAVVLDVDGILVGFKYGPNFPMPSPDIVNALKTIKESGVPVILCTGRSFYTPVMEHVIKIAGLDNFHIGEMGCLTTNPLSGEVFQCKVIGEDNGRQLVRRLLKEGIFTNYFTPEEYYVQKDQAGDEISELLTTSIEMAPRVVDSLEESVAGRKVLYVSGKSKEKSASIKMENIFRDFEGQLNLLWGNNLFLTDYCDVFFLPAGISKAASLKALLGHMEIPFETVLGAGDGNVDWDFMKLCGYRATLQNASPSVLKNVAAGDPGRNFIGPHVDQNGILEVFRHFNLFD